MKKLRRLAKLILDDKVTSYLIHGPIIINLRGRWDWDVTCTDYSDILYPTS